MIRNRKAAVIGLALLGVAAAANAQVNFRPLEYLFLAQPGQESAGESVDAEISPDGRYVVFMTTRPSVRKGHDLATYDVIRADAETGALKLVNRLPDQSPAPILSYYPRLGISDRGRGITFTAPTNLLTPYAQANTLSAFHANLETNVITRIGSGSFVGELSRNGTQLAYLTNSGTCDSMNLVNGSSGRLYIPAFQDIGGINGNFGGVFSDSATARMFLTNIFDESGLRMLGLKSVRTTGQARTEVTVPSDKSLAPVYISDTLTDATFITNAPLSPLDTDLRYDLYRRNADGSYRFTDLGTLVPTNASQLSLAASRSGRYVLVGFDINSSPYDIDTYVYVDQTTGAVSNPRFYGVKQLGRRLSDDGRYFAVAGSDGHAKRVNAINESQLTVDNGPHPAPPRKPLNQMVHSAGGEAILFRGVEGYVPNNLEGLYIRMPDRTVKRVNNAQTPIAINDAGTKWVYRTWDGKTIFRDGIAGRTIEIPQATGVVRLDGAGDVLAYERTDRQLYYLNLRTRVTKLISRTRTGAPSTGSSGVLAVVAGNGSKIFFSTTARDLAPGADRYYSTYEYETATDKLSLIRMKTDIENPGTWVRAVSYDGTTLIYGSVESYYRNLYRYYVPTATHKLVFKGSHVAEQFHDTNNTYLAFGDFRRSFLVNISDSNLAYLELKHPYKMEEPKFRKVDPRALRFLNHGYPCEVNIDFFYN